MWVISDLSMVNEIFIKRFDNFYAHAVRFREVCESTRQVRSEHGATRRGHTEFAHGRGKRRALEATEVPISQSRIVNCKSFSDFFCRSWTYFRTLSADAFTNKAMRAILPTIKTSAREIVAHVEKQSGAEIDTQRWSKAMSIRESRWLISQLHWFDETAISKCQGTVPKSNQSLS